MNFERDIWYAAQRGNLNTDYKNFQHFANSDIYSEGILVAVLIAGGIPVAAIRKGFIE